MSLGSRISSAARSVKVSAQNHYDVPFHGAGPSGAIVANRSTSEIYTQPVRVMHPAPFQEVHFGDLGVEPTISRAVQTDSGGMSTGAKIGLVVAGIGSVAALTVGTGAVGYLFGLNNSTNGIDYSVDTSGGGSEGEKIPDFLM